MISEKTVELNLTTELTNWAWKIQHKTFTPIAPTQVEEAKLGYDVSMLSNGFALYIQYKRAELKGTEYIYKLNRTKARDQHKKLCALDKVGVPVYYGLPIFTEVAEVLSNRRRLLMLTLWISPSTIPVPNSGVGHHEVHYESTTGSMWVTSEEEIDFDAGDTTTSSIENQITGNLRNNLREGAVAFNNIFVGGGQTQETQKAFDDSQFSGGYMFIGSND